MFNYQEAMKNFTDLDAIQENFRKFYDLEALQDNLAKAYDLEAAKENFSNLFNNEASTAVKEVFEKAMNQEAVTEAVEKNVKLASELVATNTNVVADAVAMQSVQLREGVEKTLKQVDTLIQSKDVASAFEAQTAFSQETQESLRELAWTNVGIMTNAFEANANLVKAAFGQPAAKKAPARKPAAKKAEAAAA